VNLIGEHTDYNDGFVLLRQSGFTLGRRLLHASTESLSFTRRISQQVPSSTWMTCHRPALASGVTMQAVLRKMLEASGSRLSGANLLISGDVPQGAGLSSSASMEVAVGYALLDLAGQTLDLTKLAQLCQHAENEFVGARCGIMDQFIASHGRRDHALLLDCRFLEYRVLPLHGDARLVICNTMIKHNHATGEYNRRRSECEAVSYIWLRIIRACGRCGMHHLPILRLVAPRCRKRFCGGAVTSSRKTCAFSMPPRRWSGEIWRPSES